MVLQIQRGAGGVIEFHKPLPGRPWFYFIDHQGRLSADLEAGPEDHVAAGEIRLMNLGGQHVVPVHKIGRVSAQGTQLLAGISHGAAGPGIPCGGVVPDGAEQLAVQIVDDTVIHHLIDGEGGPGRIAGKRETFPEQIDHAGTGRAHCGLQTRSGQPCRFKSQQGRATAPSAVIEAGGPPCLPGVRGRQIPPPRRVIVKLNRRAAGCHFGIPGVRSDGGVLLIPGGASGHPALPPVAEIVEIVVFRAQDQGVTGPISRFRPASAILILQFADWHSVLVLQSQSFTVVVEGSGPWAKHSHIRRNPGIGRPGSRFAKRTDDDAFAGLQKMCLRGRSHEVRKLEADSGSEAPLRDIKRGRREVPDFKEFRLGPGRMVHHFTEHHLLGPGVGHPGQGCEQGKKTLPQPERPRKPGGFP